MPSFSFDIEDVFYLGEGYEGVSLFGPAVDTSGGLAVGDILTVPTKGGGSARCECVGFPLVNLGPERVSWVRVSVSGVSPDDIQVGKRANRAS